MVEEGFAIWTICRVMSNLNAGSKWYSYPGNVQEYRARMIQAVVNDVRRDSNIWWTESRCSICDETKSTVSKHSLDGDTTNHCDECFEAIQAIAMSISDSGEEHTIDGESFQVSDYEFRTIEAIFFGVGAAHHAVKRYDENFPLASQAIDSYQNRMQEIADTVK